MPGLIILEHELRNDTAQAFINNYYLMPSNNWTVVSAAEMNGLNKPYQNAEGTTGAVTYAPIVPRQNSAPPTVISPSAPPLEPSHISGRRVYSRNPMMARKSDKTNGVCRTSTSAVLVLCAAVLSACLF